MRVRREPMSRIDQQSAADNDEKRAESPSQRYPHINLDSKNRETFPGHRYQQDKRNTQSVNYSCNRTRSKTTKLASVFVPSKRRGFGSGGQISETTLLLLLPGKQDIGLVCLTKNA